MNLDLVSFLRLLPKLSISHRSTSNPSVEIQSWELASGLSALFLFFTSQKHLTSVSFTKVCGVVGWPCSFVSVSKQEEGV